MHTHISRPAFHYVWKSSFYHGCRKQSISLVCRSYATHQEAMSKSSSLLSHALDQKRRNDAREDYVGPYQMGLIPPTRTNGGNTKKWSELSAGGKAARTAARSSNLVVILVGAGLSGVLIYALTSELFSSNSSTVLYGKACAKLDASPKLAATLPKPYIYHNNPPIAGRPRHRNHNVTSQLAVDSSGREHMLLHFFVESRPSGSHAKGDSSFDVDSAVQWSMDTLSSLSDMSFNDLTDAARQRVHQTAEGAKDLFKFLSGDSVPEAEESPVVHSPALHKEESGWTSGFSGLFSGLRAKTGSDTNAATPDSRTYTEGEVHADLIMNEQGYFEFRYLLVDIPNSQQRNPKRVFIERAPGVRDNEPVLQWYS